MRPCELQPARLLCPWDVPGKNTGVGCHSLPQGIFAAQRLNSSWFLPSGLVSPFGFSFWFLPLPGGSLPLSYQEELSFACGSAGKESARSAEDLGLIPRLGRSPGERKGYPLQYSGLENSMGCIVHGVPKSRIRLSDFLFSLSRGRIVKPELEL